MITTSRLQLRSHFREFYPTVPLIETYIDMYRERVIKQQC